MKKFEYKIAIGINEFQLNSLGRDGWELMTTTLVEEHFYYCYHLKRELN